MGTGRHSPRRHQDSRLGEVQESLDFVLFLPQGPAVDRNRGRQRVPVRPEDISDQGIDDLPRHRLRQAASELQAESGRDRVGEAAAERAPPAAHRVQPRAVRAVRFGEERRGPLVRVAWARHERWDPCQR